MTRAQKITFIEKIKPNVRFITDRTTHNRLVIDIIVIDGEASVYNRSPKTQLDALHVVDKIFNEIIKSGDF